MATGTWKRRSIIWWLLAVLVLLALLMGGCASVGIWASKKIYPALQPPEDKEPPPTFRIDTPSTQLSALVGGQGGGISCSIPALMRPLFFRSDGNLGNVNLRFRQACAMHDLCYRHGEATYGYSQADCDFALLEGAFRICAIAFVDQDKSDETKEKTRIRLAPSINATCPDQARLVLLGVRVGGGNAFKTGANSTYLDYDPMPAKANDYTVMRWVGTQPRVASPDGSFYYFHHLNGRVATTAIPKPEKEKESPRYDISYKLVPTPPSVVRGTQGDALFITARQTAVNTYAETYRIDMLEAELRAEVQGAYDPDSSVSWVPASDSPTRLSFWRRYDASVQTCELVPKKQERNEDNCINPQASHTLAVTTDTYRTLQHPPLRGRFLGDGCDYYAIPRRGGALLKAGQHADKGRGFEDHLGFLLAPVDTKARGCRENEGRMRDVPEALEPLGVFATQGKQDLLIGFQSDNPSNPASKMHASLLSLGEEGATQRLTFLDPISRKPLNSEWLRRPISIVRPDVVDGDDTHIVMTRVEPDTSDSSGELSQSSRPFWVHVLSFAYGDRQCVADDCTLVSTKGISCRATGSYDDYMRAASGLTLAGHFDGSDDMITRPLQVAVLPKGKSMYSFMATLLPHTINASTKTINIAAAKSPITTMCEIYRRTP